MIDQFKFSLYFKDSVLFVAESGDRFLNYEILSLYGLKLAAHDVGYVESTDANGEYCLVADVNGLSCPWESIPSSFSGIALKVWDSNDMGFPRLEIKASPAKCMQGHNVFGSTCIKTGAYHMLRSLQLALPDLIEHIEWPKTTLDIIDVTYSCRLPDQFHQNQFMKFIKNVSNGQMRRSVWSDDFETTAYLTPRDSKKRVLKVYLKGSEVANEINKLNAVLLKNPENQDIRNRLHILSDPKLLEFADGLVRFEARLKKDWMKRNGYPRLLSDWLTLQKKYIKENRCLIAELWSAGFNKMLDALKGKGINMQNKDSIHTMLKDVYATPTKKGFSYAKADRIFAYYMRLLNEGYDKVYRTMARNTFGRTLKDLIVATGLSKAQLQNLSADEQTNIIPFCRMIEIDFSGTAQRPDWYKEPVSDFSTTDFDVRPLKVVNL